MELSSRGSFFACYIFAFKLIYEGFEGVSTYSIYLYIFLYTFEGLFTLFTNYAMNYSAKKITRRKILDPTYLYIRIV